MPAELFGSEEHTRNRKIFPNVNSISHQRVIGSDSLTANQLQIWMPKTCVSATLIPLKIIEHLTPHDFNSSVRDWTFPLIAHVRVVLLILGRSDGWARAPETIAICFPNLIFRIVHTVIYKWSNRILQFECFPAWAYLQYNGCYGDDVGISSMPSDFLV